MLINLKKFLSTSRYDKPHGILFLFYPCIWGISLTKVNILEVYKLCIIFFIGSCGMRALGCIWNDLNDKRFDILVNRTKKRLIALGKVSKSEAVVYMIINFLIGSIPLFFIIPVGVSIGTRFFKKSSEKDYKKYILYFLIIISIFGLIRALFS